MKLALTRGTNNAATSLGSGWFLRMRTWFATLPMGRVTAASSELATSPMTQVAQPNSATVLSFPFRGDALLVRLAEILMARIADAPERADFFILALRRAPRLRLVIDVAAYVEFDPIRSSFSVVVDVESGTQLTLDTGDFDTLVRFVVQYVRDKLAEPIEPDGAA